MRNAQNIFIGPSVIWISPASYRVQSSIEAMPCWRTHGRWLITTVKYHSFFSQCVEMRRLGCTTIKLQITVTTIIRQKEKDVRTFLLSKNRAKRKAKQKGIEMNRNAHRLGLGKYPAWDKIQTTFWGKTEMPNAKRIKAVKFKDKILKIADLGNVESIRQTLIRTLPSLLKAVSWWRLVTIRSN